MNNDYFVSVIRNCITMPVLLRHYGFDIDRGNRIACPFHSGKDKNLGFKDDFYHCFVCGASGDLIEFVKNYFGLSFSEALSKLNDDFLIGLPIGKRISNTRKLDIAKKAYLIKKERESKETSKKVIEDYYWKCLDEFIRLDTQIIKYKPNPGEKTLHPLYVDAIKNIEYAKYALGCAQEELIKFEHSNTDTNSGIHGG